MGLGLKEICFLVRNCSNISIITFAFTIDPWTVKGWIRCADLPCDQKSLCDFSQPFVSVLPGLHSQPAVDPVALQGFVQDSTLCAS